MKWENWQRNTKPVLLLMPRKLLAWKTLTLRLVLLICWVLVVTKGYWTAERADSMCTRCQYYSSAALWRYGQTLSEFDRQPEFLPDKLESGTPNTPGIAGLLSGINFINEVGIENIRNKEQQLAQQLIEGLKKIEDVAVYSPNFFMNIQLL